MKKHSYIGLGVHKQSISIAVAEEGARVRGSGRVGVIADRVGTRLGQAQTKRGGGTALRL